MTNTKKYLGERIKELRKKSGLKQSELAELVNIDSKHMSKIECGRCFPSFDLLDKIAVQFKLPLYEMLMSEHLETKEALIVKLTEMLNEASVEKVRLFYKIFKEII